MIKRVLKFELVGDREKIVDILRDLKEAGIVHIEEYPKKYREADIRLPNEELYRKGRNYLNDLESLLGNRFPRHDVLLEITEEDIRFLEEQLEKARELVARKEDLISRIELIEPYFRALEQILSRGEPDLIVVVPKGDKENWKKVEERIRQEAPALESTVVQLDSGRMAVALKVGRLALEKVRRIIEDSGFLLLKLPSQYQGLSLAEAFEKLKIDYYNLKGQLFKVEKDIKDFFESIKDKVSRIKTSVLDKFEDVNVLRKYSAYTKYAFFMKGWVQEEDQMKLLDILEGKYQGHYFIKFDRPVIAEYEKTPVSLKNPKLWKPFEVLLDFFQYPKYGTIDPTFYLWFFFPVYFGFMLGDAGYGLILLISLLFFRWANPGNRVVRDFTTVYIWAAVFTIIFGALYGEFFGEVLVKAGIVKPIIHRTHDINLILALGIGAGVVQVLLGFLLGIINGLRLKDNHHALFNLFNFLGVASLFFYALHYLKMLVLPSPLDIVLLVILVISAIAVFKLHGPVAPIELVSSVGHIVSFARLSAVAIASAILADLPARFFEMLPWPVAGLLVGLLFHAIAFILGIMDPTIQGLRLQFVEFFTKFFEGTTKVFKPLKKGGLNYVS